MSQSDTEVSSIAKLIINCTRDGENEKLNHLILVAKEKQCDFNYKEAGSGNTATIYAAKLNRQQILNELLLNGADPTLMNNEKETALNFSNLPCCQIICDSLSLRSSNYTEVNLCQAAWQGCSNNLTLNLKSGTNVNCVNSDGYTPLMLLCRDLYIFQQLQAKINISWKPEKCLLDLLLNSANVLTSVDHLKRSATHLVASSKANCANLLISKLLNYAPQTVNARDIYGFTPLHYASLIGNISMMKILIDSGADCNIEGYHGSTPMHLATMNGNIKASELLLINCVRASKSFNAYKSRKSTTNVIKSLADKASINSARPSISPGKRVINLPFYNNFIPSSNNTSSPRRQNQDKNEGLLLQKPTVPFIQSKIYSHDSTCLEIRTKPLLTRSETADLFRPRSVSATNPCSSNFNQNVRLTKSSHCSRITAFCSSKITRPVSHLPPLNVSKNDDVVSQDRTTEILSIAETVHENDSEESKEVEILSEIVNSAPLSTCQDKQIILTQTTAIKHTKMIPKFLKPIQNNFKSANPSSKRKSTKKKVKTTASLKNKKVKHKIDLLPEEIMEVKSFTTNNEDVLLHGQIDSAPFRLNNAVISGIGWNISTNKSQDIDHLNIDTLKVTANADVEIADEIDRQNRLVTLEDPIGSFTGNWQNTRLDTYEVKVTEPLVINEIVPESNKEPIKWKRGNVIGKGANGTVWCGLTDQGCLIAVKRIELETWEAEVQTEYKRVAEEVAILQGLNHPNIVKFLGTDMQDANIDIFMELVPGGSLAALILKFGPFEENIFKSYTRQMLNGLVFLHDARIVHRDIKGANIMLMANGVIKLIDFGCAKQLKLRMSCSKTSIQKSLKGSPFWMAPEVICETGHGTKSDVWSLGATVFEIATGKPPWSHLDALVAIFAIGSGKYETPRLSTELFSEEAVQFVSDCMTRDQFERPSSRELLSHAFIKNCK